MRKASVAMVLVILMICMISIALAKTVVPVNGTIAGECDPVAENISDDKVSNWRDYDKYHSSWQYWSQGASAIGPGYRKSACFMVAQSKLLVEAGIASGNPNIFNPDEYVYAAGYQFTNYAVEYAKKHGKSFSSSKYVSLSSNNTNDAKTIMQYLRDGYGCILDIKNADHFVYVWRGASLEKGTPVISDSSSRYSWNGELCYTLTSHSTTYEGMHVYKFFTATNTPEKPVVTTWTNLHTEDSQYGLFNAQVNWSKSLSLKEVGCFVGTSKSQVEGAKMDAPNGTAVRKDVITSNIESMASYLATDTTYGLVVFYKGPSFDTISRFIGGATYYYKFYSHTSDGQVIYSSVEEYTPALTGSEKLTNVWMKPSTDTNLTVGDSINLTFGSDEAVTFYFHVYDMETGIDTSAEIGKNMISGSYTYTFNKAGSYNIWMGAAHKSGDKASNGIIVTVNSPVVYVSNIALDRNNVKLEAGDITTLKATISPNNATNKSVSWSSSNSNVAKVDANGKVTAVKSGKATITVTTEDGQKTATCTVTVTAKPEEPVSVTEVKLSKTSLTLTEQDTVTLTATVAPADAKNKKVTWSSSNSSVAKVDANGKVTAVMYGKATITVTTEDGKKKATCTVTVDPKDKVAAFVTRCYRIILGREPDAGGMKTWYNELVSGRKAASEIIDNFVRSQEFLGKHYSNADAVEILYKAMLGRGSDAPGKATWVGKLDAGYPFAVVINGFCGSKEFKEICDSYGIAPGSVSMEQGSASDQQIRAFVTRCYNIILGRGADEVGMNTWFSELKSRRRTAAEIIEQFVYSQEFQNKKYSNPDAVEILYKAMLGRGSDPAGKADWVGRLAGGQPLTAIINGFCGSMEFTAICEAYGITPGSVQVQSLNHQTEIQEEPVVKQTVTKTENNVTKVEIVNPSDTENEQLGTAVQAIYVNEEKAKEFIGRCYRCILGREASQTELDGWIGQMLNGTKTADQIARGFLFSGEFKDKNVSNEELVKILYRVYLNREADAEGLVTWTQKLDEGTGLNELLNVFAKTGEFKAVLRNMAE